jgi:hypothetical protein
LHGPRFSTDTFTINLSIKMGDRAGRQCSIISPSVVGFARPRVG